MERVQSPQSMLQGSELPSLAPFPETALAPALELLASTARSTPGQEGRDALVSLTQALTQLSPSEENAKVLSRLIDDGAFHELVGDDGTLMRELAVETLLRLGYPYALQIHPDELAWYRNLHFVRRRNKWLVLLTIFGVGAIAETLLLRLF